MCIEATAESNLHLEFNFVDSEEFSMDFGTMNGECDSITKGKSNHHTTCLNASCLSILNSNI